MTDRPDEAAALAVIEEAVKAYDGTGPAYVLSVPILRGLIDKALLAAFARGREAADLKLARQVHSQAWEAGAAWMRERAVQVAVAKANLWLNAPGSFRSDSRADTCMTIAEAIRALSLRSQQRARRRSGEVPKEAGSH